MEQADSTPEFSLLGGPLHRLGTRLGLVRHDTGSLGLGLALGLLAWGVLVVLAFLQGVGSQMFVLPVIGGHIRLLVAIPLFFLCEAWVVPRMAEFVRELVRSGVVPPEARPGLTAAVRRVGLLKDSWLAELLLLALAWALPLIEPLAPLSAGVTGGWSALLGQSGTGLSWANGWYLAVCLPLFRFLVLRWLWRLGLWCWFLWRLQKLDLRLFPTHPDGSGGLGYLEVVHEHFAPLVFGFSAVISARLAEDISSGSAAFEALYRLAPLLLVLMAVFFIGPLCLFCGVLWRCRVNGWSAYMAMASRYVEAFDRRWIRNEKATGEEQLGTADLQSLADLANSVDKVRGVRWLPASERLVTGLVAAALLPLLPLLLLKYPVSDLAQRLFSALTGL